MDLNSPLFDRIRIKQQCEEPRETEGPACEHPGCKGSGLYRAPKGRGQEGRYFQFCLDHLAYYKAPAWIHIVQSLPTTGTQKIQKHNVYPQGVDPRGVAGVIDLRALKRRRRD